MTTTTTVNFKKLRDGSWGVSGRNLVKGQSVTVTKKSGQTSQVTIGKILFTSQDGYQIATIVDTPRPAARNSRAHVSYWASGCHTDGNCSSLCDPASCPCGDGGGWFSCC